YGSTIAGVEHRAATVLLIRCSDRHGAGIDRHARAGAVIALDRERRPHVLNADRARLHREGMRGIVHDAEVCNSIERHQTMIIARARNYQSAGRTKQDLRPVFEHDLPALAYRGRIGAAAGIEFGPTQVLPQHGATNYDDCCRSDSQQGDKSASRLAIELALPKGKDS